jgi:hypothetical protein
MTKVEVPLEWDLGTVPRYMRENMERAMRGQIERGLVELITDSDDSYRDLEEEEGKATGKIRIEIERKKKGFSIVRVRDRARGMSREEMYDKLGTLGKRTSGFEKGKPRRGLHGRGARDIVAFGTVHYESIKGDKYNHLIISPSLKCHFAEPRASRATQEIRNKLGIPRGNGTVVTVEVGSRFKIPQHETLVKNFSRYYALRDIFSNPKREVVLADLGSGREDRLIYRYSEGDITFNEWIEVPNYPEAKAHLLIRQHSTPFEQDYSPYREGVLVKSAAAIHECTYFGLDSEPFAWRFSGELYCEFIDKLIREYDDREEENPDHPSHSANNPMKLLDPHRDGLIREHPFTDSLYRKCRELLRNLIEKLKAAEVPQERSVTNRDLDRRLNALMKQISKVFEQDLKELEEEIPPGRGKGEFIGLRIIPSGEQPTGEQRTIPIVIDQPKTFSIEVRTYETLDESLPISIESSDDAKIKVRTSPVYLVKFSEDKKAGRATFTVESSELGAEGLIEARYNGYDDLVLVKVVQPQPPPELPNGLSFDKPLYHLRVNKEKALILWLKADAKVVGDSLIAKILSDNSEIVIKGGGCRLHTTDTPGVFVGRCMVIGRQLKAKGDIIAQIEGFNPARTCAIVEDKPSEGIRLNANLVEKDFGSLRYKWDNEDKPQLLEIGAKHPSIRRYLGEPINGAYPNIGSPLYHAVLAEVIAEALAFSLLKKCFKREGEKWDYDFASRNYHMYFSKYISIAHKIVVSP